jgi:hypothetical protein
MGLARAGLVRNALSSLAVLATVAFFAFGLPILDRALPAGRLLAAGTAYPVGGGVTVVPPPGASVDLTRTRPAEDRGTALFVAGGVRLAFVVIPYQDSLDEAGTRVRNKITKAVGVQVTGPTRQLRTAQGVTGMQGTYSSPGRFGEYAVFANGSVAVEITASGTETQLRAILPELELTLRSVSFGGGP